MDEYRLPFKKADAEFTEKKSRFIGHVAPVSGEAEALDFLRQIREKHPQASHNVYAYRLYEGGLCRHSDDGEPSGTAGMPFLDVFLKRKIYDFCAVATRYFGGVMLGAGGLVRAYARTGALALDASGIAVYRTYALGEIVCDYAKYEPVRRLLEKEGAVMDDAAFTDRVTLTFSLPAQSWDTLCASLTGHTSGTVSPRKTGDTRRPEPV